MADMEYQTHPERADSVAVILDENYDHKWHRNLPEPPGNVKCFDIPSGMESLKKRYGVTETERIRLVFDSMSKTGRPVVPLDPGDYNTEFVKAATMSDDTPKGWESPHFPLVFDSGGDTIKKVYLGGFSGMPQEQMDNLVGLPNLEALAFWDTLGKTSGLHIKAPRNAARMQEWGVSLSDKTSDNTADSWDMPDCMYFLMEGFRSVPDMSPHSNSILKNLVLRNCNVDTALAQEILSRCWMAERIDISNNPDIETLPYPENDVEERCYHTDSCSFSKRCTCSKAYTDRTSPDYYKPKTENETHELILASRYHTLWRLDTIDKPRLEAYGLPNLQRRHYPQLRGVSVYVPGSRSSITPRYYPFRKEP